MVVCRWAIRLLEEERDNLVTDLNAATCKEKLKEDNKYKAKFTVLINEIEQNKNELNKQKQIEKELDKEIFQWEIELNDLLIKNKKSKDDQLTFADVSV